MAIITASSGFSLDFDPISFSGFSNVTLSSPTGFRFNFANGTYWDVVGTALTYGGPNGLPTAGTITGLSFFLADDTQTLTASGLSLPAADFSNLVQAPNASGFVNTILAGADTIFGNDQVDDLRGGNGSDVLVGGEENDTLRGQDGDDIMLGDGLTASIVTTPVSDTFLGGNGSDYAQGGEGNDRLYGEDGDDWLEGGPGNDHFYGGDSNDALFGGAGNDEFSSGDGDNYLSGGDGDDRLNTNQGSNWVDGGAGNDTMFGGETAGVILARSGNDTAEGGDNADYIEGGAGNDFLIGNGGNDVLEGDEGLSTVGAGNDSIDAYDGADVARGGAGDDRIFGGNGNDFLEGNAGNDRIVGDEQNDTLLGQEGRDVLRGEGGADTLWAGAQNDTLLGGSEGDILLGEDGDDHLTGGAGNDVISGGAGSDTVFYSGAVSTIGSSGDTLTINAGAEGIDTLISVEQFASADTDVPLAPTITGYTDDTGTQGDFITSDPTPTLSGTAEPFALVTIFQNGSPIGSTSANAGGNWSFTVGSLQPGFYDFTATATDLADNESGASNDIFLEIAPGVVIELTSLGSTSGFVVQGDTGGDFAGAFLSGAGDINGDGFDDLIVAASYGDDAGYSAGEAYVVFGAAGGFGVPVTIDGVVRQVIDLTSLASNQGFVIQGDTNYDAAGRGVSTAGDVNGDGFQDLIVGALGSDLGGPSAGQAYVIFGGAGSFGTPVGVRQVIDLASLASSQGFVVRGDTDADYAGISVASAGDVNGDGLDDLMVGADGGDDGSPRAGEAYVIFGSGGLAGSVVDLTSLVSARGFIIQGDAEFDLAGRSVSAAGDVNGDGYADMLVAAPLGGDGGNSAGETYVVFGSAGGFGVPVTTSGVVRQVVDLTSLTSSQGFIIQGDATSDSAGHSVAAAGDINGDGFDDLIVGAANGSDGGTSAGEAYVIFGSATGFGASVTVNGVVRRVIDLTSLTSTQGFIVQGDSNYDQAGVSVSGAGDINGDGLADMLVGASGAEAAYVLFGSTGAFGFAVTTAGVVRQVIDLGSLPSTQGFIIRGDNYEDSAGSAVAIAGDINGDGFDDILVGAPRADDDGEQTGEAYVVFGAATSPALSQTLSGSPGANTLIGNWAADTLIGNGGGDIFRGGARNDLIQVPDLAFVDIDGGNGIDTFQLTSGGLHLNLVTIPQAEIQSIEVIDLTGGGGSNTLTGTHLDFFGLTEDRGTNVAFVRIDGDSNDTVVLDGGWTDIDDTVLDTNTYDVWRFDPDDLGPLPPNAHADLWIDKDIDLLFSS